MTKGCQYTRQLKLWKRHLICIFNEFQLDVRKSISRKMAKHLNCFDRIRIWNSNVPFKKGWQQTSLQRNALPKKCGIALDVLSRLNPVIGVNNLRDIQRYLRCKPITSEKIISNPHLYFIKRFLWMNLWIKWNSIYIVECYFKKTNCNFKRRNTIHYQRYMRRKIKVNKHRILDIFIR